MKPGKPKTNRYAYRHRSEAAPTREPSLDMPEIPEAAAESLQFPLDKGRHSRILALLRAEGKGNRIPDALSALALPVLLSAWPVMLLFTLWFWNATAVWAIWLGTVLCFGLPLLGLALMRERFGLASWLHRHRSPELVLEPGALVLTLGCTVPGRRQNYCWVMPYAAVTRLEYDRSTKLLRIHGGFDEERSRRPEPGHLPSGMCKRNSRYPNAPQWLELPLIFAPPEKLLSVLEERTGKYIHPAMRGDDLAELRDLPGLPPEREVLRKLSAALLVFTLTALLCVLGIRSHFERHPYLPYPATETGVLLTDHAIGDAVVLDGCEIELRESVRVASRENGVCYQLMLVLRNGNDTKLRMRTDEAFRNSPGNFYLTAYRDGIAEPLTFSAAPPGFQGFVQDCPEWIPSGINVYVTLFFWLESGADEIVLSVNSDYWPPVDWFRDVQYTGTELDIGGQAVKSNEVRFVFRP